MREMGLRSPEKGNFGSLVDDRADVRARRNQNPFLRKKIGL